MKDFKSEAALGSGLGLYGKTAVITGGAVNIGRAISLRLAGLGMRVVIVYSSSEIEAVALSDRIVSEGGISAAFRADVGDEQQVTALFRTIASDERFGRVDLMVNNSGIFSMSDQVDLPAEEWQRLFNVNAMGTFLCSREAAKLMKIQTPLPGEAYRGVIVNVVSINALHPGFGRTVHYDATKGAVYSFTRSLAAELGPDGIRVNGIAPGLVDSAGLRSDAAPLAEMVEARNPLAERDGVKRLVQPGDVADAVVFLASGLASSVTGEVVVVDRGYLLS